MFIYLEIRSGITLNNRSVCFGHIKRLEDEEQQRYKK